MYKKCIFALVLIIPIIIFGQNNPSRYRVCFKDKNNSPYDISNPQAFLSKRAIDRRVNYNIPFKQEDIPINPWYLDSLKKAGAIIINSSKWFNSAIINVSDINVLIKIKNYPFVLSIDTVCFGDVYGKTNRKNISSKLPEIISENIFYSPDNTINNSKYLKPEIFYEYGYSFNQIQMVGGNTLHNLGFKGEGIIIAVIDGGFYGYDKLKVLDSIRANNQIISKRDFINPENPFSTTSTHGARVLSIMGANLPNLMIGTAPKAKYMLLRSEYEGSEYVVEEDNWAAAIEYADSAGADIVNSSLGYSTFDNPIQNHSIYSIDGNTTIVTRAADIAASKGIIVVNSAGNEGNKPWRYITSPADGDSVLAVGSVNDTCGLSAFSSIGNSIFKKTKPNVVAQGEKTVIDINTYNKPVLGNGTSFSSPIICGMMACLKQSLPEFNNYQLIKAVESNASKADSANYKYGYGIPNFTQTYLNLKKNLNKTVFDNSKKIYPNPFYDELNIIFYSDDTSSCTIEIIDNIGKTINKHDIPYKNIGLNYFKLNDLTSLSQGIYIIKITANKSSIYLKAIKGK